MPEISISQKLGFNISDMVDRAGRSFVIAGGQTRYHLSVRLIAAMEEEAAKSHRSVPSVFLDLLLDVHSNYRHKNGPFAQSLDFQVADLVASGGVFLTIDEDPNTYILSRRLINSMRIFAEDHKQTFEEVFRSLQRELCDAIAPTSATNPRLNN